MKRQLKKIVNIFSRAELGILPASLAYYLFLAIIPILTIIVLIASSFNISLDRLAVIINDMLPQKVAEFILEIINGRGFDTNVGMFNLIAFIVSTNGTYAIIKSANSLYNVKNSDIVRDRIKSVIILIDILLLFIFMMLVPIFGEKILLFIKSTEVFSGITDELIFVINIIKWPLTFFIILINIKLIYTISPSKQISSRNTTVGALVTTISWMLFSVIFGYYIEYFARYDILYGNLSSIIILLIWLYSMSFMFVLGMIINTTFYKENNE